MKITSLFNKTLGLAIIASSAFTFSCGDDDDKPSCSGAYEKITSAFEDVFDEDCEVQIEGYEKIISLLKKYKSCADIKEAVEDEGYESVAELIEELEDEKADIEEDCNQPA